MPKISHMPLTQFILKSSDFQIRINVFIWCLPSKTVCGFCGFGFFVGFFVGFCVSVWDFCLVFVGLGFFVGVGFWFFF